MKAIVEETLPHMVKFRKYKKGSPMAVSYEHIRLQL